ncbi:MAG: hypothetical protein JXA36_00570 [Coriobacteriia bacterium]|nr:hypothetical protein [Coriobacteriia bacterium]
MSDLFCNSCGAPRTPGESFCTACGSRLDPVTPGKRSRSRAVAFGCLALVLACSLSCGAVFLLGSRSGGGGGLSADQKRVAEEFGLPRTFSVVIGEDVEGALEGGDLDVHRIETWDYHEMGTRFVFRDGAVVGTRDISVLDPAAFAYPAISPASFSEGMSPDDVSELLGGEPGGEATLSAGLGEEVRTLVWSGVVSCTFVDGELAVVETAPLQIAEVAR